MSDRVIVVGAGVVGLTCAIRLARAGIDTHVIAADLPQETTSAVAGAFWFPALHGGNPELVRYAGKTLSQYLSQTEAGVGVQLRTGVFTHRPDDADIAPLASLLTGAGLPEPEPAEPKTADGWARQYTLPMVTPPTYLRWLVNEFEALGGTLTRMGLQELPRGGVVVNATGVRAKWLVKDHHVTPVRGQVVWVDNPGLEDWWYVDHETDPAYALPHGDLLVIGGSRESGVVEPRPDPARTQQILARAAALDPRLAGVRVRGSRVGIRPGRAMPRVQAVEESDRTVIHCYGHGGSGWSLAWGTADAVLGLADQMSLF